MQKFWIWILRRVFKKQVSDPPEIVSAALLRSAAKLAENGRASVFRGGQRAFMDAMIDPDRITYILTIDTGRTKQKLSMRRWFHEYAEKQRRGL